MNKPVEEVHCSVQTLNGTIRGIILYENGRSYYKFKRIPYAKPPLGQRRFLPPYPIEPWHGEIDCTKDAPPPLSYAVETDSLIEIVGSEDCLYVEISTPDIRPSKPMPVMFWLGCFAYAFVTDKILDPRFINDQNVVYVRCGFRIGPLGFLSINEMSAPGNIGLKDVVMALKWVQQNISTFGGDPNNVTLFGNSSGGAIVHLMMLSPMATGLFHKAIIQSTSALNSWALCKNPCQAVLDLAEVLGINTKCKMDIVEILKTLPALDIMEAYKTSIIGINKTNEVFNAIFKPSIEGDFEGQPAFITKPPGSIIKSGNYHKVPLIIGSNYVEGAILQYMNKNFYDFESYNENLGSIVPRSLAGQEKLAEDIGLQLLSFYLGDGETCLGEDTKSAFVQMLTDYYFIYYLNQTVRLHAQTSPNPVYYYIINSAGEWSVPEKFAFLNSVGHCADLPFLFGVKIIGESISKGTRDSVTMRSRIVKMWTNFARYGNPTPDENDPLLLIKWDPVEESTKLNYLSIGVELTKGRNPFLSRMQFWDKLHKQHAFQRVVMYFNDLGIY